VFFTIFVTNYCEYDWNSSLKSDTPNAMLLVSLSPVKRQFDLIISDKEAQVFQ